MQGVRDHCEARIVIMLDSEKIEYPSVSIIINTDGRAKSLAVCLDSIRYLKYPNFEVVVVAGPTRDGTHELCRSWGDKIVFADCPERNLSMSRNISIAISSGEFVGFLDDDSIPEPEWLNDVMPAFEDPAVGVAGGYLHDHTGKTYQWKFGTLNRFGTADTSWTRPAPEFNFPGSFNYPHVMANSVFRRTAVVEAGGFDEEYEYFLDESDLILRFVDLGWKVAQLDKGFIHHKYMPSHIRNESKVLTSWYSLVKNKTYFSLVNNGGHYGVQEVMTEVGNLVNEYRRHVQWAAGEGLLASADAERFEQEVDLALRHGLERGIRGNRRLPGREAMQGRNAFCRFPTFEPDCKQRCYVLLTRTYPPAAVGGIGRYIHQLALELAGLGYQVHVLTQAQGHDTVDFESGVWVHRITPKACDVPDGMPIPAHLWNYSRTMLAETAEIASRRTVDAVYAPVWDLEPIAFVESREFPVVSSLQTMMVQYLTSNEDKKNEPEFMCFASQVLSLERRILLESSAIHAISHAIVSEIENAYSVTLHPSRVHVVPLGLGDWTILPCVKPQVLPPDRVRVVFVGRQEFRKGADVFLSILPDLLQQYPQVHVDIVGNDQIPQVEGDTFRVRFERSNPSLMALGQVVFHGDVTDEELRGFYSSADFVVAPSRFESFGLVHLEAMMFGKPVIGCRIGGMQEIILDGVTGMLAEPADAESLLKCVEQLIQSEKLRATMGRAARQHYLDNFKPSSMAKGVENVFQALSASS